MVCPRDSLPTLRARARSLRARCDLVPATTIRVAPVTAAEQRGQWWRFGLILLLTVLTLVPLGGTLSNALGLTGGLQGAPGEPSWASRIAQSVAFTLRGQSLYWFENSLMLSLGAVVVCIVIGAPAGYVLARARSRAVSAYALVIFMLQSFPPVLLLVPLFLFFAHLRLVDNLFGLGLVYIGLTLPFAIWMFASYLGTVPIELEEAAWLDGCSVLATFFRVVLRNSLPAVLTTSIFTFLAVWNDYLAAFIFIRSPNNYTLGVGLQSAGHTPILAVLIAIPPVLVFVLLNRYFSVGGVAGSLASR